MPRMAVLLNATKPAVPRDDTLQELGDFDSSNPIFVSQMMFLIIDLRSTLDVLKAADIQVQDGM